MSIRLNKLLAQRGVGARRKCDALIQQGAVRVNGRVVREPGTQVEPGRDAVTVGGEPLAPAAAPRYFVLNKPVGIITTLDDPEGRRTVRDFLPPGPRLFPVGRLDADTSGLLLLTNDGALAHRLMHPRYGVGKVYRVRTDRAPSPEGLRRLQQGVEFEPGVRSAPADVRVLESGTRGALLRIELHEGRYRQVRRMCEAVGLAVLALHRSAYGPLRLGPVPRGMWRELSDQEVSELKAASARPRPRGPVGYRSPRAGGDSARRLARRLQALARGGEGSRAPRGPAASTARGEARGGVAARPRRARPSLVSPERRRGRPPGAVGAGRGGAAGKASARGRRAGQKPRRAGRWDAGSRPARRPRGPRSR